MATNCGSIGRVGSLTNGVGGNEPDGDLVSVSSSQEEVWIETNIRKRECVRFAPASLTTGAQQQQQQQLCQCGRAFAQHHSLDPGLAVGSMAAAGGGAASAAWRPETHTVSSPTDAYGVIEFASGPHPTMARYIRVAEDTDPALLLHVLTNVWRLPLPKLVLSVHGGMQNFELQPRLRQLALSGLLKAAKTTDAWLISTGLDNGVSRLVGEAIGEEARARENRVCAIGIAPWGVIRDRDQLLGRSRTCKYFAISSAGKSLSVLNRYHSYFLLVDDGRCGSYGTESQLRRNLERYLCSLRLCKSHFGVGLDRVPVVATLLEGGASAFRLLLDLTLGSPPVPVVVCDGSGRAADILAFVHKYSDQVLSQPDLSNQLVDLIESKFHLSRAQSVAVIQELRMCFLGPGRLLIFVFRPGEGVFKDLDDAILTSLLTSQRLSRASQLKLTMAWDRMDLARSHLFQYGQDWKPADLDRAMMEALMNDRIDFIRLFLEWGVNVQRFLTRIRLEELYSFCLYSDESKSGHDKHLRRLLKRTLPKYSGRHRHRLSLYIVGRLIQELIGGGYTHEYTRRYANSKAPLAPWSASESKDVALGTAAAASPSAAAPSTAAATPANANVFFSGLRNVRSRLGINPEEEPPLQLKQSDFRFPYSDLMTWAVLCRRYTLAWFFLQCGEDSTAKALYAAALLRAIAARVDEDVQSEYHLELADWADKYETEALAMLDHCHRFDPRRARRLVTYRLAEFGGHTCMSLAYTSRSMRFLSHACPQVILNDLWYGGIRESGQLTGLRVVLLCGILAACPPAFFLLLRAKFLSFKSLAELRDQPQTREEFDEFAQQEGSDSGDEASEAEQAARTAAAAAAGAPAQAFVEPESLRNLMRSMPADSLGDKLRRMESPDVEAADADVDGASKNPRATEAAKAAASQDASPARQALLSAGGDSAAQQQQQKQAPVLHYHLEDPNRRVRNYTYRSGVQPYGQAPPQPPVMQQQQQQQHDRLPYRMCVSEFFSAPITRYWLHLMSYAFFIASFLSYALVALPQKRLLWQEVVVFAYVASYAADKVREVAFSGGRNFKTNLTVHLSDAWNVFDLCVCAVSAVGIATRLASLWCCVYGPAVEFDFYANYSRLLGPADDPTELADFAVQFYLFFCSQNIMVLALGLWLLRVFEVLINWKHLGPYLYMVASMMGKMLPPIVIIFVPLCAFGIIRQGIQYPGHDRFNITVVKGILLKPYFMLYGEVYADEIDPDGWSGLESLMPLRSIVPISMVIFLLVTVIVCISIIIAVFNDIYHEVHEKSKQVYKYLRFSIIIEYESMPVFPPPFSLFSWLYLLGRWLHRRLTRKEEDEDEFPDSSGIEDGRVITSLKLFLRPEEAAALQSFESQCVQDLLLIRTRLERGRSPGQLSELSDRQLTDDAAPPAPTPETASAAAAAAAADAATRVNDLTQRHLLAAVERRIAAAEAAAAAAAEAATAAAAAVAMVVGSSEQQPPPQPQPPTPQTGQDSGGQSAPQQQRQPSIRRPLRRASSISETPQQLSAAEAAPLNILLGLRPPPDCGYTSICDAIDIGPTLATAAATDASEVSVASPPRPSPLRRLDATLRDAEERERSVLGSALRRRLRQFSITGELPEGVGEGSAAAYDTVGNEAEDGDGREGDDGDTGEADEKASLQDIMEVALERLVDAELRDCGVDQLQQLRLQEFDDEEDDDGGVGDEGGYEDAMAMMAAGGGPSSFDLSGDPAACPSVDVPDEADEETGV
ncbi:hypothetical protein BOX15_Mlig017223g1 [Macrostomum lignano]|uniref:TRPM SLOG domain-containing protein n=1 Tax=Macrostomum lignano TaxID=282301 RepID=A0A267ED55_9PLAT|nr:hypothetical protein BOX15_Mlig017223g1 [Macrostomum lignano]